MASRLTTWLIKRKLARRFGGCNGVGLHKAIRQCNLKAIRKMIELGVSVESRDPVGRTPLFQAVRLGEQRLTEELLVAGASPDGADDEGNTPFMEAVKTGDKHILERLLLEHPQVNKRNQLGETALILAVREGNTTFTRLLLKHGAEVNLADQRGRTPLMLSVMDSKTAIITSLLEAGADPTQQDMSGQSCLDIPVGTPRIAHMLRNHLKQQESMYEEPTSGRRSAAWGDLVDEVAQKAQKWLGTSPPEELEARGKELLDLWRQNLGTRSSVDSEEWITSGAGLLVLLVQEVQRGFKQLPAVKPETQERLWNTLESLVTNLASGISQKHEPPDGEPEQHIHFHLPALTKEQEKELDHALSETITHGTARAADLLKLLGAIRSNGHPENGQAESNPDAHNPSGDESDEDVEEEMGSEAPSAEQNKE